MTAREQLAAFDLAHIPNLDVAVLGALELFAATTLPQLHLPFHRPLVLGSGNAFMAAQIIFANTDAVFADESQYELCLASSTRYDGVVVMSASGGKHAVPMTEAAMRAGLPVHLITNNAQAPAASLITGDCVHVFPMNREPYTYNTSTYLGPILAHTNESPAAITAYVHDTVVPRLLRNFNDYNAYTFIIPNEYLHLRGMLRTKFDELFGPCLIGRFFTPEEIKHAKTVVVSGDELFISLGFDNQHYGLPKNRLFIPLPERASYGAALAAAYFIVGKIQAAHPPYFAQGIEAYAAAASALFGHTIKPIVE